MKGSGRTQQTGDPGPDGQGTGKSEESRNLKRSLKGVRSAHSPEPDYERPVLELGPEDRERIVRRLAFLYGEDKARACMPELERILKVYHAHKPQERIDLERAFVPSERFCEEDVILITYGDLLRDTGTPPIATLAAFCDNYLKGRINTIHILPFFPYSSDRGFSVVDFETVDPNLGTWQDIEDLDNRYQLMFDGVINHVSAMSRWFQEFLNGNPDYEDFFISFASRDELTPEERRIIFRPRTSDILSRYRTIHGDRYVWTTFSRDQVDLNYSNPQVLLRIIDILLMYVRHGADIIRLDAVTYIWAEPGTCCVHLSQAHEIVKLFRTVLDIVAPTVALITETNVPHKDNISYFGDGRDEAHMVYNFALPPLVLHAFYTGDVTVLSRWAGGLERVSETATYFNFLDSHDGIGLMALRGILPDEEIQGVIAGAEEHGGRISYKTAEDGSEVPYEINITWFSALNREDGDEDVAFQVKRFVASRVIALVLRGVPGIYLHSMIGTLNDIQGVQATRSNREINRTVLDVEAVTRTLEDPFSKFSRISREFGRLINIRTRRRAFHPNGDQRVLTPAKEVFTVLRVSPEGDRRILTLTNVTDGPVRMEIPLCDLGTDESHWYDAVSGMEWFAEGGVLMVSLQAFDAIWLEPFDEIRAMENPARPSVS